LGELVGLMDLVGKAEPEPDVGGLLSAAVGEFVMGSDEGEVSREPLEGDENRRLLGYATRRVGDFYGFKAAARK
jgi:hypothetical protein